MSRRKPLQLTVPPLSPLPPPTARLSTFWHVVTVLLACAYVGLTVGHLYTTPVALSETVNYINAPDEAAHLGYIRALSEGNRLPSRDDRQYPTYEWHQPPLYYLLGVPFYGAGAHAVRYLSLAFGLLGLLLIFRTARRLFPDDPALAVFAMGFAALLPMRQAITAAVGNDAMAEFVFSVTLMLLMEAFHSGFTLRRAGYLGVALGLALLTKATGLLLLPVVLAALFLLWREGETPEAVVKGGLWLLALAALLCAPWYVRNIQRYREFTPMRAFLREFAGTSKAVDWIGKNPLAVDPWTGALVPAEEAMSRAGYLQLVVHWTFRTFWAAYTPPRDAAVGVPRFLPPTVYLLYALFTLAALAGLIRLGVRHRTDFTARQRRVLALLFLTLFLVAASFAGFVWTFFQAQGRYLYPALLPLSLLGALGFRALFPSGYRDAATGLMLAVFLLLALAFLVTGVMPAYS